MVSASAWRTERGGARERLHGGCRAPIEGPAARCPAAPCLLLQQLVPLLGRDEANLDHACAREGAGVSKDAPPPPAEGKRSAAAHPAPSRWGRPAAALRCPTFLRDEERDGARVAGVAARPHAACREPLLSDAGGRTCGTARQVHSTACDWARGQPNELARVRRRHARRTCESNVRARGVTRSKNA